MGTQRPERAWLVTVHLGLGMQLLGQVSECCAAHGHTVRHIKPPAWWDACQLLCIL